MQRGLRQLALRVSSLVLAMDVDTGMGSKKGGELHSNSTSAELCFDEHEQTGGQSLSKFQRAQDLIHLVEVAQKGASAGYEFWRLLNRELSVRSWKAKL